MRRLGRAVERLGYAISAIGGRMQGRRIPELRVEISFNGADTAAAVDALLRGLRNNTNGIADRLAAGAR